MQLGAALTQTQISALDKPMLWYVEQTVPDPSCTATGTATCPTITALMPQVYLPGNTSAMSAGGNISGQDVTLNFGKGSDGSVLNTGSITASDTLTVSTNTLTNQVDVGQIWSKVKGGYVDETGTTVQPGGFMSAANMDLNVQTINQIGGALQQLNADGTVNQAGTQALLAQLRSQLGTNFTQTMVHDNLHTDFVAEGGFGIAQIGEMVMAVALSIVTAGAGAALVGAMAGTLEAAVANAAFTALVTSLATDVVTGNFSLAGIAESVGVAMLTAGITSGITYNTNTSSFGIADWTQNLNKLGDGVHTLGQLAGTTSVVGTSISQSTGSTATTLSQQGIGIATQSTLEAGVQTAIKGGSFLTSLETDAVSSVAAVGANGIGTLGEDSSSILAKGSIGYDLAHAALGCAASAAEGTGCASGAIGGAVSAAATPYIGSAVVGSGTASPEQTAVITALAMLAGGGVAGALGQNAMAGATAAENEAENNCNLHECWNKVQSAFTTTTQTVGPLIQPTVGLVGSITGVAGGALMTGLGAVTLDPLVAGLGVANLYTNGYGIYSNAVNLYNAWNGSTQTPLPGSGFQATANYFLPNSQTAQNVAELADLGLAFGSGKVAVSSSTVAPYGTGAALTQGQDINSWLNARAAAPTGQYRSVLIPDPMPPNSTITNLFNFTTNTQYLSSGYDFLMQAPWFAGTSSSSAQKK